MTTEELYDLMEDGNLGYACVYKQGDQGMHTDYMFKMTAENIANFIDVNNFNNISICRCRWQTSQKQLQL